MKILKFFIFSLIIVLSLNSCGSDDETMVDAEEQQTTDDMDGDGDGDVTLPNLLLCTTIENFTYEIVNGDLTMDWDDCNSSNGSNVSYNIDIKAYYYNCDSGNYQYSNFLFEEFINSNYTLENVGQVGRVKVNIRAVDANGNWSSSFQEIIKIVPSNGIYEGNLAITTSEYFELLNDAEIHTVNGDLIITSSCPVGGNFQYGNIDSIIGLSGITTVTGNIIFDGTRHSNLTSLEGLESLVNFDGDVTIENFTNLNDISAISNITSLNNLTINNLPNLSEIIGFNNINESVGDINIQGSATINILNNVTSANDVEINTSEEITAFTNVITLENLNLGNTSALNGFDLLESTNILSLGNVNFSDPQSFSQLISVDELLIYNISNNTFDFLNNLEEINTSVVLVNNSNIQTLDFESVSTTNPINFTIQNNSNLQSITGLNNITSLKSCTIQSNNSLISIDFLSSINTITESSLVINENNLLTNLDALSNLNYIECPGQLIVTDNFNLGDLCGLQTLFTNNGLCSFKATIENNGYNPTPLQIENGDCSL